MLPNRYARLTIRDVQEVGYPLGGSYALLGVFECLCALFFPKSYKKVTPNVLPLSTQRGSHFEEFRKTKEQW